MPNSSAKESHKHVAIDKPKIGLEKICSVRSRYLHVDVVVQPISSFIKRHSCNRLGWTKKFICLALCKCWNEMYTADNQSGVQKAKGARLLGIQKSNAMQSPSFPSSFKGHITSKPSDPEEVNPLFVW